MRTALWIMQGVMAALFVGVGMLKLVRTRDQLKPMFGWVEDFSDQVVKALGGLEILAAIGLIVPGLVGIAPVVVPVAALASVALVIGGSAVHLRRKEMQALPPNVIFIAVLVLIAWGRLGPHPL